jgi:multiple sugar transport system ATP-binding protein
VTDTDPDRRDRTAVGDADGRRPDGATRTDGAGDVRSPATGGRSGGSGSGSGSGDRLFGDAAGDVDGTGGGTLGGASVTLRALTKRYDSEVAVDEVDLTVEEGELLVLLGPSGCGKTTTLRMIAGLETVTAGGVSIGGVDVSQTTPQERDVAMVFQNYALYPHKTVRENVAFPLRKLSLSREERAERVETTAQLLDIADLLDKRPAALSGGQRQRAAIGRAIAREPAVLLMDEPLSNLDAKLRVQTRSELRRLQQRLGITTVYVTHDQEEAMSIADRIAIMNDGHIEQVGSPKEVYRDPTSAFIADFLGDPSMNVLPATGARAGSGSDPGLVARLTRAAGDRQRTARVGIRPEDLYLLVDGRPVAADAPGDRLSAAVECPLVVVEPIGRAYEVTVETDAGSVVVRARDVPDALRGRETVPLAFDTGAVYAFDETGGRLR